MKILFLCTYYHKAMIFRDLMDRLIRQGHEVKAFNAVSYNTKIDEKYKNIMDEQVAHKECFNQRDRFFFHLKQKKIYNALVSSMKVARYDLIHSHSLLNGGYAAYNIKKRFGVPYAVSVISTDINTFLKIPFFRPIANKLASEAAGVHFSSAPYKKKFINSFMKGNLKEKTLKKSVVIGRGVEDFWLKNIAGPKQLNDKKRFRILQVGKIDKNKNTKTALKAINLLISKGYEIKFTVVGQAVNKGILKEIKKENFAEVISYVKKEDLIKVYRNNDIFVMPSIHETFGRVYAEAMTQGLPVIYSRGQGFDEIFDEGCVGYSAPCMDAGFIADRIVNVINNYSEISNRCIENCSLFDWAVISEKLSEFYKTAASDKTYR